EFLETLEHQWKIHYPTNFILHTLNPNRVDPVSWIRSRLEGDGPLDAVYIDRNIPGRTGLDIIRDIKDKVPRARYLPIAVMTEYLSDSRDADLESIEAGAQWFMFKHHTLFLYEAALIIPQLREREEDQMWLDLLRDVIEKIAAQRDVREICN